MVLAANPVTDAVVVPEAMLDAVKAVDVKVELFVETSIEYVSVSEPELVGAVQLAVNPLALTEEPVPTVGALEQVVAFTVAAPAE